MPVHDDVKTQMTTQMYLKTIYLLRQEQQPTTLTRLAETLHVAPPTALAMARRLTAAGFVTVGKRKELLLTEEGETGARSILRRHHLAERLLGDVVGLPWHETHDEACRLEHSISPAIEQRLFAALGCPTTCPHGNPIDVAEPLARAPEASPGLTLDRVATGTPVVVQGVNELAEMDKEFLHYLESHGMVPGALVEITRRELAVDLLIARCCEQEFAFSVRAAARVRVELPAKG